MANRLGHCRQKSYQYLVFNFAELSSRNKTPYSSCGQEMGARLHSGVDGIIRHRNDSGIVISIDSTTRRYAGRSAHCGTRRRLSSQQTVQVKFRIQKDVVEKYPNRVEPFTLCVKSIEFVFVVSR